MKVLLSISTCLIKYTIQKMTNSPQLRTLSSGMFTLTNHLNNTRKEYKIQTFLFKLYTHSVPGNVQNSRINTIKKC